MLLKYNAAGAREKGGFFCRGEIFRSVSGICFMLGVKNSKGFRSVVFLFRRQTQTFRLVYSALPDVNVFTILTLPCFISKQQGLSFPMQNSERDC